MKVKVKKLNNKAVLPHKKYEPDFCYDVVATSCQEIAPNVYKYGLGLAFQIERGREPFETKGCLVAHCPIDFNRSPINLSIDFRSRSSVWETGMILSNCEGTIDELYTGEVSAVFYHIMPNMPKYEVGDRIGQIKIGVTFPIAFVEVDELNETARGEGGYGSTGK
jgi:dUTP pyrophosphatase